MLLLSFETLTFLCLIHVSVENECRNLTKEDAPDNGGLVCHWFREENSQHCQVKCNQGTNCPVLRDCRATIAYGNFNLFAYITLQYQGTNFHPTSMHMRAVEVQQAGGGHTNLMTPMQQLNRVSVSIQMQFILIMNFVFYKFCGFYRI